MNQEIPVVLVHGFLSTSSMLWPFRRTLERKGWRVFQPKLSLLCIQDVRRLARQLQRSIERCCDEYGVERVHVVGISQGGIIALYYLHQLDGASRVHHLVTVGSPVRGSYVALGALPVLGLFSRGLRQLRPGASLLKQLAKPVPKGTRVSTLAVRGDFVSPPGRCAIDDATENRVIAGPLGLAKHQWIALSPKVVNQVSSLLASY